MRHDAKILVDGNTERLRRLGAIEPHCGPALVGVLLVVVLHDWNTLAKAQPA